MLDRIRKLLLSPEDAAPAHDDLQIAVAVLLVEAARMDDHFDDAVPRPFIRCYNAPMRSAIASVKICAALLALGALTDSVSARDRSEVPRGAGTFTRNLGSINGRDRVFTVYAPKDLKPGAPLVL